MAMGQSTLSRKLSIAMFEACYVRALAEDDLPMVLAWRNNPDVRRYMLTQHEISPQEHYNWFVRVQQDKTQQQLIVLDRDAPLGFIQFNSVIKGSIADWGFYARPDAARGSGLKLGMAALKYAFNELRLHKVCGQAIESNQASIAFHQKLGFTREGRLCDQHCIAGHYEALICFGLLAKDWQAIQRIEGQTDDSN